MNSAFGTIIEVCGGTDQDGDGLTGACDIPYYNNCSLCRSNQGTWTPDTDDVDLTVGLSDANGAITWVVQYNFATVSPCDDCDDDQIDDPGCESIDDVIQATLVDPLGVSIDPINVTLQRSDHCNDPLPN